MVCDIPSSQDTFKDQIWNSYLKELVWFIAFNTESESENIINLLLASQVLKKSKARSIALASAVKIDESSGIRCIILWLSDITAQPESTDSETFRKMS